MAPKFDLVIVNGMVVTASDISSYAIGIKDEKINTIAPFFTEEDIQGAQVIDAEGGMVMPGGIDAHVHLCQDMKTGPHGLGGTCADDFETGSRSAVCGGNTTIVTFATQSRVPSDRSLLDVVQRYNTRAEATGSYIDYGYHIIITQDDKEIMREEMPRLVDEWGITSCKLFMTYESMKLGDKELLDVMMEARSNGIMTMIHAENGDMIEWLTDQLESKGMMDPYYHTLSRPPSVEGEAANRAIVLAELIQNPILFVHVGSSTSANTIRAAQTRGLPIFAETCPQYLNLTWEDLKRFHSPTCFENSKMVCSPPPGPDSSDHEALYTGLHNGTFTIFSSDHCPFTYGTSPYGKMSGILEHEPTMAQHLHSYPDGHLEAEMKVDWSEFAKDKVGSFRLIPNGIPGVETRLPLLFTRGVEEGRISPMKFVELTVTNPAKLYGLYPQKGTLLPGSDADIVIWFPKSAMSPFHLDNSQLHHNVDYTPYQDMSFTNWPRYTIVRGKVMWANGQLLGRVRDGKYLKRGKSLLAGYAGMGVHRVGRSMQEWEKDRRRVATWLYD